MASVASGNASSQRHIQRQAKGRFFFHLFLKKKDKILEFSRVLFVDISSHFIVQNYIFLILTTGIIYDCIGVIKITHNVREGLRLN